MFHCTERSCAEKKDELLSAQVQIQGLRDQVESLRDIVVNLKERLLSECDAHITKRIDMVMETQVHEKIVAEVGSQVGDASRILPAQDGHNFDVKVMFTSLSAAVWPHLQRLPKVYRRIGDFETHQRKNQELLKAHGKELEGLRGFQEQFLQKQTQQESVLHELQVAVTQPSVQQSLIEPACRACSRDLGDICTRIRILENKYVDVSVKLQTMLHDLLRADRRHDDMQQSIAELRVAQDSTHSRKHCTSPVEEKQRSRLPCFGTLDGRTKTVRTSARKKIDWEALMDPDAPVYAI